MAAYYILLISCFFYVGFCAFLDVVKEYDLKPLFRAVRDRDSYLRARNDILLEERNQRIGHDVILNQNEERVNGILMKFKELEINRSRTTNDEPFPPSVNFLVGKPLVEKSQVFQIIKSMPKGKLIK